MQSVSAYEVGLSLHGCGETAGGAGTGRPVLGDGFTRSGPVECLPLLCFDRS